MRSIDHEGLRRRGSNTAAVCVLVVIAGVVVWLGYREWKRRSSHSAKDSASITNQPAATQRVDVAKTPVKRVVANAAPTNNASAKSAAVLDAQIALDRIGF